MIHRKSIITRRYSAYSLAELLIVVSILGLLAALSTVGLLSIIRRERLNVLTLEIAGWIEKARNISADLINESPNAGGCTINFLANPTGVQGSPIAQASNCTGLAEATLLVPPAEGASFSIKSTSSITQQLIFTPRGMIKSTPALPATGFEYRFTLSDLKSPKRCVRISDVTGTVDIGYSSDSSLTTACSRYSGL